LESHNVRQLYPNEPNIGASGSGEIYLFICICILVSNVCDFC